MTYRPRSQKNKKPRGGIPMIAYHIAVAVAALLVAALLPGDPKVKKVALTVFVAMAGGGVVVFAAAAGLRQLVRHRHSGAGQKSFAVANWAVQLGFMSLAAGLIGLFYTALLKQF